MADAAMWWDCYVTISSPRTFSRLIPQTKPNKEEERERNEETDWRSFVHAHVWSELEALEEDWWLDVGTFSVSAKVEVSDCLL